MKRFDLELAVGFFLVIGILAMGMFRSSSASWR